MFRGCDEMGEEYVLSRFTQAESFARYKKKLEHEILPQIYMRVECEMYLGNQHNSAGNKQGEWAMYYENSCLQWLNVYEDGKQEGMYIVWSPNGYVKSAIRHKHDKRNGQGVWWHDNGNLKTVQSFEDGKLHGVNYTWYPTGAPESTYTYTHGVRTGLFLKFHENGNLSLRCTLVNGKVCGMKEQWNEDGTVDCCDMYKDGKYQNPFTIGMTTSASRMYSSIQSAFVRASGATIEPTEVGITLPLVQSE